MRDLSRSLHFYVDILGFQIEYQRPESGFATISREGAHLMLEATASAEAATDLEFAQGQWRTAPLAYPFGRGLSLEITVADVQSVHAQLVMHAYPIKLDLQNKWYRVSDRFQGVRQLLVMDPDGYLLRFGQPIGTSAAGGTGA